MAQGRPARRRRIARFTAPRREAFLGFLAGTGNWTAAAKAVGIDRSTAEQRRKRDAGFAIRAAAAMDAANRRLAGAEGPFDAPGQGDFNVIRRGRGGRTQIVRAGAKRWSKKVEDHFLAALAICGNVAAAARAVGFTEGCIWARRRKWPAFRARMEEGLDDAECRIEYRLASMGSEIEAARPDEAGAGADGKAAGVSAGIGTGDLAPVPFDADLAFRFLKWRELKRQGYGGRGRIKGLPERPFPEVVDSIMRKVEAIERHANRQRLEEGWTQDEEGRMIPPGWVRRQDGGAGENGTGDSC